MIPVELDTDGTPEFAVNWSNYKKAQRASDSEPLPAEFSWLHSAAGDPSRVPSQPRAFQFF